MRVEPLASAGVRAYNGGIGAVLPAGCREEFLVRRQGFVPKAGSLLILGLPTKAAKFAELTVCSKMNLLYF